ncbi:hypothetical protein FQR65_LT18532 [Abscondita terminalis]|nr:hypothetical protein FQR65_LT18532 [Abscondita terminalis]
MSDQAGCDLFAIAPRSIAHPSSGGDLTLQVIFYRRTHLTLTGILIYKTWPWAQQMEAFRPFLNFAETESNIIAPAKSSRQTDNAEENGEKSVPNHELVECVTHPSSDPTDNTQLLSSQSDQAQPSTEEISHHNTTTLLSRKRKTKTTTPSTQSSVDKVIAYLETAHKNVQGNDDIDLTFLGYAATVKKFNPRRQAVVKYQIAKIIDTKNYSS